jgi:hypothetical protein
MNDHTQESFVRRHNRGWFELFPELRGLPYEVQLRLFQEAREACAPPKGFWRGLRRFAVNLATAVALIGSVFCLTWSFAHSRINPGISFVWIFPPAAILMAALFSGIEGQRKHRRMQRYLWRRLLWICSKCGYDMTGNESGRCPECGHAREYEPLLKEDECDA